MCAGKSNGMILLCILSIAVYCSLHCSSSAPRVDTRTPLQIENEKFLDPEAKGGEAFRVLFTSDKYVVMQRRYDSTIAKIADAGGDKYMCSSIGAYDKFNEARESIMRVWLYPDSGKLMKIRPVKPTFLMEIDQILLEDIQRWNFSFPKKVVHPTRFDVLYRVVLQKKLSDEQIMKEIREQIKQQN
ncbi:MAG TPA: hypothetical protein PLT75_04395 [Spirochaetota bacterium]|nr:hypothetical protein [Spirochaetota bacterium]